MKISPIASGGIPGVDIGTPHSQSRIDAAKAIAAGETPIRVTESDTPISEAIRAQKANVRRIKMQTNKSPDRHIQEVAPETTVAATESAISDESVSTEMATEESKPISPQLAALAKQRRALQVKERELAEREKAIAAKAEQSDRPDVIARLKSEPLRVLQEAGVTYDQLTEAILSDQSGMNPEILKLQEKIKALEEGIDKNFKTRDEMAEQQVLSEMRREAEVLAKDGDTFELIREEGKIPTVIDLIHRTYKSTGEVLEVSEAMQLVEDELLKDSLKIAKLNKIRSQLQPEQPVQAQQQRPNQIRTLTNRDGSTAPLSRRERALLAFSGSLKG